MVYGVRHACGWWKPNTCYKYSTSVGSNGMLFTAGKQNSKKEVDTGTHKNIYHLCGKFGDSSNKLKSK